MTEQKPLRNVRLKVIINAQDLRDGHWGVYDRFLGNLFVRDLGKFTDNLKASIKDGSIVGLISHPLQEVKTLSSPEPSQFLPETEQIPSE